MWQLTCEIVPQYFLPLFTNEKFISLLSEPVLILLHQAFFQQAERMATFIKAF